MDGNQYSITNLAEVAATNFAGGGGGLTNVVRPGVIGLESALMWLSNNVAAVDYNLITNIAAYQALISTNKLAADLIALIMTKQQGDADLTNWATHPVEPLASPVTGYGLGWDGTQWSPMDFSSSPPFTVAWGDTMFQNALTVPEQFLDESGVMTFPRTVAANTYEASSGYKGLLRANSGYGNTWLVDHAYGSAIAGYSSPYVYLAEDKIWAGNGAGLTNLALTNITSGGALLNQVPKWDGAKWVPGADESSPPDGGIDEATATNISVYITAQATNKLAIDLSDLIHRKANTNDPTIWNPELVFTERTDWLFGSGTISYNTTNLTVTYPGNIGTPATVGIGRDVLTNSTDILRGTAVGSYAASGVISGSDATAIGYLAGSAPGNIFDYSTAVGRSAGVDSTNMFASSLLGYYSGSGVLDAYGMTAVGWSAGRNSSGRSGVFLGSNAGLGAPDADYSVIIGGSAGQRVNGERAIVIGYQAGGTATNASYSLMLGSGASVNRDNSFVIDSRATSANSNGLIYGEFDNRLVRINGRLEVTNGIYGRSFSTNLFGTIPLSLLSGITSVQMDPATDAIYRQDNTGLTLAQLESATNNIDATKILYGIIPVARLANITSNNIAPNTDAVYRDRTRMAAANSTISLSSSAASGITTYSVGVGTISSNNVAAATDAVYRQDTVGAPPFAISLDNNLFTRSGVPEQWLALDGKMKFRDTVSANTYEASAGYKGFLRANSGYGNTWLYDHGAGAAIAGYDGTSLYLSSGKRFTGDGQGLTNVQWAAASALVSNANAYVLPNGNAMFGGNTVNISDEGIFGPGLGITSVPRTGVTGLETALDWLTNHLGSGGITAEQATNIASYRALLATNQLALDLMALIMSKQHGDPDLTNWAAYPVATFSAPSAGYGLGWNGSQVTWMNMDSVPPFTATENLNLFANALGSPYQRIDGDGRMIFNNVVGAATFEASAGYKGMLRANSGYGTTWLYDHGAGAPVATYDGTTIAASSGKKWGGNGSGLTDIGWSTASQWTSNALSRVLPNGNGYFGGGAVSLSDEGVISTYFQGNGSGLTHLDASDLATGQVPPARMATGTATSGYVPKSDGAGGVVWSADSTGTGGGTGTGEYDQMFDFDHTKQWFQFIEAGSDVFARFGSANSSLGSFLDVNLNAKNINVEGALSVNNGYDLNAPSVRVRDSSTEEGGYWIGGTPGITETIEIYGRTADNSGAVLHTIQVTKGIITGYTHTP